MFVLALRRCARRLCQYQNASYQRAQEEKEVQKGEERKEAQELEESECNVLNTSFTTIQVQKHRRDTSPDEYQRPKKPVEDVDFRIDCCPRVSVNYDD